jgi:hypothetical protein
LRNDIASLKLALEQGFATVNGNVKRVAIQPAPIQAATGTGIDILAGAATNRAATDTRAALAMMNPPTLMPNPKSLFDLWDEYLNGIGGESLQGCSRKPSEGASSISTPGGKLCGIQFAH